VPKSNQEIIEAMRKSMKPSAIGQEGVDF